jgi:hypothetical protein
MTTAPLAPASVDHKRAFSGFGPLVLAAASGMGIAFAVTLTIMCGLHIWYFDTLGHPLIIDFMSYWSAGRLALQGHALAAYDPHLRHAAEIATVGHPFKDVLGWWYPPLFLFVAAALACLPYATALNVLNDLTLLLHASVTAAISKRREAFFLAAAAPWGMFGMIHGQNQFLTASIVGGALLTLEHRPALCGILLGLLSYKPQLGLLFPVALAFGGYWRTFGWACAGTAFWTVLSGAVFGFDTYAPFLHGLSTVGREVLVTNPAYLPNLQSLYGFARCLDVPEGIAWSMQMCLSLACAIAVALLWRNKAAFEIKAAGLAAAIPLASAYLQAYDLTLLTVALSFLYRHRPFDRREWTAVACAIFSFGTFWWERAHPAALIACPTVGAIVLLRLLRTDRAVVHASASGHSDLTREPVCLLPDIAFAPESSSRSA